MVETVKYEGEEYKLYLIAVVRFHGVLPPDICHPLFTRQFDSLRS